MKYAERVSQEQRLVMLQALATDGDYRINDLMLYTWLEQVALEISMDKLRTQMRWLEEQELVTIEQMGSMLIATLTERGLDIAKGRARVDGVARPAPGSV